ncbi:hypothetical protein KKC13_02665 [bacterium]|nr:hypothetical protein [bacterium]MBU1957146.1 hypothetical protein [bacterium]
MIQATINNSLVEAFLYEKFDGDKKQITAYINDFLNKYLPHTDNNFDEDRKRFHKIYARMQNRTEEMLSEEESNIRTENFLKSL